MTKLMVISAIVHLALVIILPLIPALSRDRELGYEVYEVELLDVSLEAPVVEEAPAEVVEEPAPVEPEPVEEEPAPAPEPEPEPVIPEKPVRKQVVLKPPKERERRSLAERLADRMEEQDQTRPDKSEQKPQRQEARPATSRTMVKASRFPYAWYLSIVQGKVTSNWKQPSARLLGGENLTAVVSFRIQRGGMIEAITVRRSSGISTVDQSAAKAVRSSAPFPPLPDDYMESHLDVTIDFKITQE